MKNVLIKPLITEKMTDITENLNQYGFIVEPSANKLEIKKAIQDLYGVTVESVNTMVYPGKKKSRSTKTRYITGKTRKFKKAVVTVASGETIDFYSNI